VPGFWSSRSRAPAVDKEIIIMRFIRRTTIAILALAVGTLAAGMGPAAADGLCGSQLTAPDGKARLEGAPWVGAGTTGITPLSIGGVGVGTKLTVHIKWKNITATDRVIEVIRPLSDIGTGFRVRYFVEGANVTDQINGSGLAFVTVPAGKATPRIELVIRKKTTGGADVRQLVTGSYGDLPSTVCDGIEVYAYTP
jgi:hypothetical protein